MYFKARANGYIYGVGQGSMGDEITKEEYNELTDIFHNIPIKEGYGYKLKDDLTWEEYKIEPEPDLPTIEEKAEAYDILVGEIK